MAPISPISGSAGFSPLERAAQTGGLGKAGAAPGVETASPTGKTDGAHGSFGAMLDRFVSDVDGKIQTAGADQAKVLSGETSSLHQAMISMQEASVSFSLMVEVRNKLVDSYQEMMRMQV
jgi:flagellar hook-basal body complex protein FliE